MMVMKSVAVILLCSACSLVFSGQGAPPWADTQIREAEYPSHTYLTGFAEGSLLPAETPEQATARLKETAWGALSESIKITISKTTDYNTVSITHSGKYSETELFRGEITTSTDAEMVGVHTETYFDKAKKTLYAFAHVNRQELAAYYATTAASDLQRIQGLVNIAAQLEQQHEKAKARKQYKDAATLLVKTAKAIDNSRALGASLSDDTWQILYHEVIQALARLELLVYVNSREDLFGKPSAIVANKLKAELSENGCRFTEDATLADFTMTIDATTRKIGKTNDVIVFCYADVTVEWVDNAAQHGVYKDEQSCKGGATTWEGAGREALEKAAEEIAKALYKTIND
jgi:hypothetical protein